MRRDVPWSRIVSGALPFLITRQIFAGAGKMGVEAESAGGQPGLYQISQRADFFSVLVSIDTMNKRPLVNTRDEPHADAGKYRRFHVILGDSNMSEWASAMKIGTTALVVELIERDLAPAIEIAQPIDATKSISRDQNYDWIIELRDGRKISAIDVQRLYLHAAQRAGLTSDPDAAWIVKEWETVLNDLQRDVSLARDRVDWVAKKFLLAALQESENISWSDPWLQAIDLEYHNIVPEQGLYFELLRQGSMRRFVSEEEIKHAIFAPPETTRAYFRGRAVAKFNDAISSIQWDEIVFGNDRDAHRVVLPEVEIDERLQRLTSLVRDTEETADFLDGLEADLAMTT
jgi:proteasome accessory factor A